MEGGSKEEYERKINRLVLYSRPVKLHSSTTNSVIIYTGSHYSQTGGGGGGGGRGRERAAVSEFHTYWARANLYTNKE